MIWGMLMWSTGTGTGADANRERKAYKLFKVIRTIIC